MYVGSLTKHKVYRINENGPKSIIFGVREVRSILVHDDIVYVSQCVGTNSKVYKYSKSGSSKGRFVRGCYHSLSVGPGGKIYASNERRRGIRVFNIRNGQKIKRFNVDKHRGIGFDQKGNLHINTKNSKVRIYTPEGRKIRKYIPSSSNKIYGFVIDKAGNRLFADRGISKVIITDEKNQVIRELTKVEGASNVAIAPNGNVWVATKKGVFVYSA